MREFRVKGQGRVHAPRGIRRGEGQKAGAVYTEHGGAFPLPETGKGRRV